MMFLVLAVKKDIEIQVFSEIVSASFSSAGFFGVCPVFEKREDAEKWADGKAQIIEVSPKEADHA